MDNPKDNKNIPTHQAIKRRPETVPSENIVCKKSKIDIVPLHLAAINEDCLEAIFQRLELKDMIAMADIHIRFIPAVRLAYFRRYGKKELIIHSRNDPIVIENDCIKIPKNICIKFIEYFGPKITNLTMHGIWFAVAIEKMLLKYCADSVVNLKLISSAWYNINKPFKNVKHFELKDSVLSGKLSQLNALFPNLTVMVLKTAIMKQPKALVVHFRQLKEFSVYDSKIPLTTIAKMFQCNPQLKSFVMHQEYSANFLRSVSEYLPQLEMLWLKAPDDRFESYDDRTIRFDNVTKFALFTPNQTAEFVVNMPLAFKKLEVLHLAGATKFVGQILTFIKENTGVRELLLWTNIEDGLMHDGLVAVIKSLKSLNRLTITGDTFSPAKRIELLHECHRSSVTQMRIRFIKSANGQAFRKATKNAIKYKWTMHKVRTPSDPVWKYTLKFDKL